MPIASDKQKLTALFQELGAQNPEAWATSQVTEGINQLHRFLFLRKAWERVASESNDEWIDKQIVASMQNPGQPFAGIGHSLTRMLAAGVAREDIVDLVRGMQAQLLFDICYLLDDPSINEESLGDIGWALVETDPNFEPTQSAISGLHESLLDTDPTGREMRPRNVP